MSPWISSSNATMQSPEPAEAMDAPQPPSYDESIQPIPLIIQMQHLMPGRLLDSNLMVAGSLIKEQSDTIMFQQRTSYSNILKLLHARVKARSGITAPSKSERFLCRLVLLKKDQFVLLEKGSWPAARQLVKEYEDASLLFMFAIVSRSFSGPSICERIKRAFMAVDHRICLVEPDLPVHDEQTALAAHHELH